ncbi:hypothetical protein C8K36_101159 [Rhodococcus sp. OK519]|nr:hypothetical protein C8K36_101159 [Rhodococcus sp. OK519]
MGSSEIITFLDAIKSLVTALNNLSSGSAGGGASGSLDTGSLSSLSG